MKAIIALALLAFVASAQWNFTAQHLGFCNQLNLTAEQTQTDIQCFANIHQTIVDIVEVVQNLQADDSVSAASAALQALSDYQNAKIECQEHFRDLVIYMIEQTGTTDLNPIFQENFHTYYAEIFQQIGQLLSDIQDGEAYDAGQTVGYVLQILLGVEKPEVQTLPQINFTDYVQFNETEFLTEFLQSYLGNFGATQDQIDAVYQCAVQTSTLNLAFYNLSQQEPTNLQGQLQVLQQYVDLIFDAAQACIPGIEAELELFAPQVQEFQAAPVLYIYNIVHNVLLNFPQIQQQYLQEVQDIINGNYTQAGQDEYGLVQMVFEQS